MPLPPRCWPRSKPETKGTFCFFLLKCRMSPLIFQTFCRPYDGNEVALVVGKETIRSTFRHPYWVVWGEQLDERPRLEHLPAVPYNATTEGRWVDAGDVRVGDEVLLRDGRIMPVEAVQHTPVRYAVYNFEVEDLHCYAVGEIQVLVHNNNGDAPATGGMGNIGGHGSVNPTTALSGAQRWLGLGYREIAPGVFRSADGLRQFRMTTRDLLPTHGDIGPHVHFEVLDAAGVVIENLHLPITP